MTPVQQLWAYFMPARWHLRLAALLAGLTTVSTVSLLATSGWLIARASQMPPVLDLSIAIVGVRTFALLRSITRYSERIVSHNATFASLPRLRVALYEKLEELTPAGLAQFHRGDLMSRVVSDVDDIQDLPLRVYLPVVSSAIAGIFCIVLTGWILPAAGLIIALALLLSATVIPRLALSVGKSRQQATAEVRSELSESLLDFCEGLADIMMLDASSQVLEQIDQASEKATSIESSFASRTGLAAATIVAIQGMALVSSIYVANQALSLGNLTAVNTIVIGLIPLAAFESVSALPAAVLNLSRVRGAASRLSDILGAETALVDGDRTQLARTDIKFTDVSARWPSSTKDALSNVSFDVPVLSVHALIGQSGSGKSTAIAALTKLLPINSGKISIGDEPFEKLNGESIRGHIVASGHDAHIFATSIAENLGLAATHPLTEDRLWQALESVELSEWVQSLPNELDTVLGDFGTNISGGQRQRLLLARLFIAQPDVWVIDEPTEHLNAQLADRILANVRDAAKNSSLILATHRLSDTSPSDSISVLCDGEVIEQGIQEQLAKDGNYFARTLRHEQQARARIAAEG